MIGVIISCALLALASAGNNYGSIGQPRSSSCAATLCVQGTICIETRNPLTGIVTTQCVSPGPAPAPAPAPAPVTCRGVICNRGFECVLVPVQCVRAPCYPQPVCLPVQTKPGVCPRPNPGDVGICASNCKRDSDCVGTFKCCRNACGASTCQDPNPPPPPPTCDNVNCGPRKECVLITQGQCYPRPCPPRPVCVPIKPGTCPRPGYGGGSSGVLCQRPCDYDGQCEGTQKCCVTLGCGRVCVAVSNPTPTPITCRTLRCVPGYVCQDDQNCGYQRPCGDARCVRSNQHNGYFGGDIFTDLGFKQF